MKLNNKTVLVGAGLAAAVTAISLAMKAKTTPTGDSVNVPSSGDVIRIDPGHGGHDPGAVGANSITEKELNLAAGLTLKYLLEQKGINSSLTRESDSYPEFSERTKAGTERALVSLHHDTATTSNGVMVYYNDYTGSRELATALAKALEPFNGAEVVAVKRHTQSRFGRLFIQDFRGVAVLVELGPTKAYGREERIKRVGALVQPLIEFVRGMDV